MYTHEQSGRPHESITQSPLYKRESLGFMQRALGGGTIIGITTGTILLWFLFRPAGQPTSRYLGEILGTTAIVLFSCSLVVATRAPFLERFFGGLDRMYLWHRWSAIAGVVLLFPHYVLVTSVQNTISNSLGNALGFIALFGLVFLLLWALIPRLPVVEHRLFVAIIILSCILCIDLSVVIKREEGRGILKTIMNKWREREGYKNDEAFSQKCSLCAWTRQGKRISL